MRYKNLTILSGVIAALAFAQGQVHAIELLGNNIGINIGGLGGGGNPTVSVNVGGTKATVDVNTGGGSTASVNASVNNGSSSVLPNTLSANVNIDGGHVTVDLNGDGVIDDDDTAMAKLDINGDGVLNLLDDANDDGILSDADLDMIARIGENDAEGVVGLGLGDGAGGVGSFSVGGLPVGGIDLSELPLPSILGLGGVDPQETPSPGIIPNPGVNPGPIPGVTPGDLTDTLRNLNDDVVAALKIKCADVMANPNAFSAATVSICKALASL